MDDHLITELTKGNTRALARAISIAENEDEQSGQLLLALPTTHTSAIIGITGPPGAGKSTLVDAMISEFIGDHKKVAVLCIDPSSPFHLGAVLGDRIRMSDWYTDPRVFIRSVATRGTLGGLSPGIIGVTELVQAAGFDVILVETAGIGQTEIEIAALADLTVLVLVPESGDEVQTMKAGVMEIADVFVINKSDRPDAEIFEKHLRLMLAPAFNKERAPDIIKTVATEKKNVGQLVTILKEKLLICRTRDHRLGLTTEKAWQLLLRKKMRGIDKERLRKDVGELLDQKAFNLYRFVERYEG